MDINKIKMLKLARRNLIRYRCKINWMRFLHPTGYSGRQLYRLFKKEGLADISTHMCGVTFTDYPFTRQLVLMDKSEREALAQGVIAVQELEQLHNFWEQANADGDFFASVSMILVSGCKS